MVNSQENKSLSLINTFGIEAKAAHFTEIHSLADLDAAREAGVFSSPDTLILGGGSNMLLTRDLPGWVAQVRIPGIVISDISVNYATVTAGAGVVWHDLVEFAISHNLGGIENLSLIPGCVGAAPMQNIGAYGVELKDVFESLTAMHLGTGRSMQFSHQDCRFGYRESVFKREAKGMYLITSVTLRLNKKPELNVSYGAIQEELAKTGKSAFTIRDVSDAVIRIRRSKLPDPAVIGNAGSFFKNPEIPVSQFEKLKEQHPALPSYPGTEGRIKVPAGWLIEQAGWKGKRFGNYGVHTHQALVLVNYGGASGLDIYNLSSRIVEDIREKYGIELEREVNVV